MKKLFLLSLLITGSLTLIAQTADLTARVDSLVNTFVKPGTPGCAIGVVKDGKILYKKTSGLSNLDYRIPVTDSTVFNLASVSKQFTAYLMLLLEKEGKLSLNDTMQKYIPELNNYGHAITIRQLLHHTSGIPSNDNLRIFAGLSQEMPWDVEDEFDMIQSYQKLNFKPNEERIYSNEGYYLLTRIVEKVTGKTFSQCMSEYVFKPLDMNTASIYDSQGETIFNRASGYRKIGENFSKTNTEGDSFFGSTNMYASVNDMTNWIINLTTGTLGGKQIYDRLINPTDTLNNGDTISYTYGLSVWKHKGLKMVDHGGFTMGFKTQLMYLPEGGFSVFVLSNNESINPWDIAIGITDWYLKDQLDPEIKIEHKENEINKDLYKLYMGSYIMTDGMVLRFDNENDTLKLIIPGAPKFVLYPEKENEFFIKDFDAQCTFVKDGEGKVNEIVWHQNNQNPKGIRFNEPKPLTQNELVSYTGRYEIPELDVTYPVTMKDNQLIVTLPKTFRMVGIDTNMKLKHLSGDKFHGTLGSLEFKRNKEGKVTGFVIADIGRIRNIEFTKK
jgi:CubicO group peptidase (beta-lactamase class C family)